MPKTLVDIDVELLAQAQQILGTSTKKDTVPVRERVRVTLRWCGRGDSNPYVLSDTRT